ncbi:MAG: T9SS type A sorting domain-containing protein [Bacteroidales bacterium]|nr:T9SS type A sorting domain-containing protein [Bacteroidales bacterium]
MQKLDSLVVEEVSEETGQVEKSIKDEFYYTGSGLLSTFIEFEWDLTENQWIKSYKDEYAYDENENCIQEVYSYWNIDSELWELSSREVYSYSPSNQVILLMSYQWEEFTNSWKLDYKDEYTYLSSEQVSIRYNWNSTISDWEMIFKMKYLFNDDQNLVESTSYYWEPVSEEWINLNLITHSYNNEQQPESIISRFWDPDLEEWYESNKELFSYSVNGDLILHSYFDWDYFTEEWAQTWKEDNTYNSQYGFAELVVPELFEHNDAYFNHMLTQLSAHAYYELTWEYIGNMKLYYSEIILSGFAEPEKMPGMAFPNPTVGSVTFAWPGSQPFAALEIVDMKGQIVVSKLIENNSMISLASSSEGIYTYRLSINDKLISTGKILRQKDKGN